MGASNSKGASQTLPNSELKTNVKQNKQKKTNIPVKQLQKN